MLPTVSGGGVFFAAPDCVDEAACYVEFPLSCKKHDTSAGGPANQKFSFNYKLSLAEGNNIYRCVMGWRFLHFFCERACRVGKGIISKDELSIFNSYQVKELG